MLLAVNVCSLLPSPLHLSPSAPTSQSSQAGWSEHLCWPTTFLFYITLLLFVSQLKHPSFKHRWLSFSIILSHSFSLSFLMFCLFLFLFDILLIQPLICHACSEHVKRVATGATKDVEGSVSSRNICESGRCHKRSSFARDCPPFLSLIHAAFCVLRTSVESELYLCSFKHRLLHIAERDLSIYSNLEGSWNSFACGLTQLVC